MNEADGRGTHPPLMDVAVQRGGGGGAAEDEVDGAGDVALPVELRLLEDREESVARHA